MWRNERGQTLLYVLVGATLTVGAMLAAMRMMSSAFQSQKHVEMRDEMLEVRRGLSQGIKCETTIPDPAVCNGSTPIVLRDAAGKPITSGSLVVSGPLMGSARKGEYYVRATCSNTERTLTVRLARARPDGTFLQDPMTKRFWDFNSAPNPVFGPTRPLCQEVLGGSAAGQQCPANHTQVGLRADGQPECREIGTVYRTTSCPSGQALNTINWDGSVTCRTLTQSYAVPSPVLKVLHPDCYVPGKDQGNLAGCMAAGNRWCLLNGFWGGMTVEYNTISMYVICIGAK